MALAVTWECALRNDDRVLMLLQFVRSKVQRCDCTLYCCSFDVSGKGATFVYFLLLYTTDDSFATSDSVLLPILCALQMSALSSSSSSSSSSLRMCQLCWTKQVLASCPINFIGILLPTPLEYVISLYRRSLGCVRLLNHIYPTLTTLYHLKIPLLLIKIKRSK